MYVSRLTFATVPGHTREDSGTGAMMWRGMASGDVDANASPKKHDKKIHKIVQKIFHSYPPKE